MKDVLDDNLLEEPAAQYSLFEPESKPNSQEKFTFIDLFAGIGGFRIAMQNLGGKCIFSSEWDEQAQKTYEANFGDLPYGDITLEETKAFIPEKFDILCAGFSLPGIFYCWKTWRI